MSRRSGELWLRLPVDLPMPVQILSAGLAPVTTATVGETVELDEGLYALRAVLPDGSPYLEAVRIGAGEIVMLELPLSADEDSRKPYSGKPFSTRGPRHNWWLDYVAVTPDDVGLSRPSAEVEEVWPDPAGTRRLLVNVGPDRGQGFLLVDTGVAGERTMIRLAPTGTGLEIMARGSTVRGRGLLDETPLGRAVTRLVDRGERETALQLLENSSVDRRAPLLMCLAGFLNLRTRPNTAKVITPMDFAGAGDLADAWVLEGQLARRHGKAEAATKAFLRALDSGVPVLSEALSCLVSGLRRGIPEELERPDGSYARQLDGLARLASQADLGRTLVTVDAGEQQLLSALADAAPPNTRLQRPAETRSSVRMGEALRVFGATEAPWRPAGLIGDLVVGVSRRLPASSFKWRPPKFVLRREPPEQEMPRRGRKGPPPSMRA